MKKTYQAYLFDLYGTLVDIHTDEDRPALWDKLALLLTLEGAPYTGSELRACYLSQVAAAEADAQAALVRAGCPDGRAEIDIAPVFAHMLSAKGVTPREDDPARLARIFRALSLERLRPFPGARELLLRLRKAGKGVYLLSNAQTLFTRPELTALGLDSCFDGILLSSEAGRKKPDPAFFRRLMDRFGLDPDASLMVGNDDEADCWGAAAVGLDSRYLSTPQSPPLTHPLPPNCLPLGSIREVF